LQTRATIHDSDVALRVLLNDPHHHELPNADSEMIDRALSISTLVSKTWMISNDTAMRFNARNAGLETSRLAKSELKAEDA